MNNPGPSHWTAVKKIFGYLKATKNIGICFGGSSCTTSLIGFSDAEFAADIFTKALPPERYRRLRSQLGLFETTECSSVPRRRSTCKPGSWQTPGWPGRHHPGLAGRPSTEGQEAAGHGEGLLDERPDAAAGPATGRCTHKRRGTVGPSRVGWMGQGVYRQPHRHISLVPGESAAPEQRPADVDRKFIYSFHLLGNWVMSRAQGAGGWW
ncbi:hypothetical protein LAZ67_9000412 [Cordylochernes scorpioides]|uniref:Uncharacterized protein n=1 Tax=Cordylochernes scorpioides TaxID=51811 RepID=A0ABY6KSG7_9ARAC|nr:hypothetical protein LAZ67_9000412 [Cordylochernes scorpioides]